MRVSRYNTQAVRETAAVPCKLNNVKMTFITLDNYMDCLSVSEKTANENS